MALPALIGALAPVLGKVLDRVLPDPAARANAEAEMQAAILEHAATLEQAAASIIRAEAGGDSWLQRNWRPILMLTIVAIVANNYLLAPYLRALFGTGLELELPERLWDLMTLGVGGYVIGRSAEKGVKAWRGT